MTAAAEKQQTSIHMIESPKTNQGKPKKPLKVHVRFHNVYLLPVALRCKPDRKPGTDINTRSTGTPDYGCLNYRHGRAG